MCEAHTKPEIRLFEIRLGLGAAQSRSAPPRRDLAPATCDSHAAESWVAPRDGRAAFSLKFAWAWELHKATRHRRGATLPQQRAIRTPPRAGSRRAIAAQPSP